MSSQQITPNQRRSIISYDNSPEQKALNSLNTNTVEGLVLPPNSKYVMQAVEYKLAGGARDRIADKLISLTQLDSKPQVQLAAIELIVAYMEGKPIQQVKIEHSIDPQTATKIAELAERLV